MFSFMKKDKVDKKEKKERKDGKKTTTKSDGTVAAPIASSSTAGNAASGSNVHKLTADELMRLDEVRRSLKIKSRRKEKEKLPSGITADYTANFNLAAMASSSSLVVGGRLHDDEMNASEQLNSSSPLSGSNSETSLNSISKEPPQLASTWSTSPARPLPPTGNARPVPPSRGILKGRSSYGHEESAALDPAIEDDDKLVENTLKNELIIYERPPSVLSPLKKIGPPTMPKPLAVASPTNGAAAGPKRANTIPDNGGAEEEEDDVEDDDSRVYSVPRPHAPLDPATMAAIAASTGLTRTEPTTTPTGSVPAGEGYGWTGAPCSKTAADLNAGDLSLPPLVAPTLPEPRDLTLIRQESGDFGFSLRRAVVVERANHAQTRYTTKNKKIQRKPTRIDDN